MPEPYRNFGRYLILKHDRHGMAFGIGRRRNELTTAGNVKRLGALWPISGIADRLGIPAHYLLESYGKFTAKLRLELFGHCAGRPPWETHPGNRDHAYQTRRRQDGSVNRAGAALDRLGRKAIVTLREPSLGPVFGLKGGATGGGSR